MSYLVSLFVVDPLTKLFMYNIYGYIYLRENLITGARYIGQHKYPKPEIDEKYKSNSKLLMEDIKKYGKDNFSCTLLDVTYSKEDANRKEQYWINSFGLLEDPIHYNRLPGGEMCGSRENQKIQKELWKDDTKIQHHSSKNRKLKDEDYLEIVKLYNNGIKPSLIAKQFNIAPSTVSGIVSGRYNSIITGIKPHNLSAKKAIGIRKLKDEDYTKIIELHQSGKTCAEIANIMNNIVTRNTISKIINGKSGFVYTGVVYGKE